MSKETDQKPDPHWMERAFHQPLRKEIAALRAENERLRHVERGIGLLCGEVGHALMDEVVKLRAVADAARRNLPGFHHPRCPAFETRNLSDCQCPGGDVARALEALDKEGKSDV